MKTTVAEGMHFYNWLDGQRVDLTSSQFAVLPDYRDLPSSRAEAAQDCSPEQYHELRTALWPLLNAP